MEDKIEHYHTDQCSVGRGGRWPKPCDCGLDKAIKNLLLEAQLEIVNGVEIWQDKGLMFNSTDKDGNKTWVSRAERLQELQEMLK